MVAGCPKCSARYRVDADRIGPDGAKLRCTKCSAVFLVRASKPEPVNLSEACEVAAATQEVDRVPEPSCPADSTLGVDPGQLVLVADPDEARGKQTADAVRGWGLTPILVHDGVEAMLEIQRRTPGAIVLDAALPKMFGFQVCEVVKRNESLRDTKVILVGAIHHQDRYRRSPVELYGADVYIEGPDLPDALRPLLLPGQEPETSTTAATTVAAPPATATPPTAQPAARDLGPEIPAPEPVIETPAPPPPPPPPAPSVAPAAPAPPSIVEDPERTAERERAQRLARIAVSEMVLYQPEKFDLASQNGTLEQTLDLEIQEARALLRQRIGDEVRAETDFIIDELRRVAEERGETA